MYVIPYEADFECPKGHRFTARTGAMVSGAKVRCPECYEQWIAANVPDGVQVSDSRMVEPGVELC